MERQKLEFEKQSDTRDRRNTTHSQESLKNHGKPKKSKRAKREDPTKYVIVDDPNQLLPKTRRISRKKSPYNDKSDLNKVILALPNANGNGSS